MSEAIIVAIVGVAGTIGGAMTTSMFAAAKTGWKPTSWLRKCKPTTNAYGNGTARWLTTSTKG